MGCGYRGTVNPIVFVPTFVAAVAEAKRGKPKAETGVELHLMILP
jgi:hypothetical protein